MAENIESVYDLDISGYISKIDTVLGKWGEVEDKMRKASSSDPFKEAARSASNLDKELSDGLKTYAQSEAAAADLRAEFKRIADEMGIVNKQKKEFLASEKYKSMQAELNKVRGELDKINSELGKTNRQAKESVGIFTKLKGSVLGALSGLAGGGGAGVTVLSSLLGGINPALGIMTGLLGGVASKALGAQAGWQGLNATLEVALGSSELVNKDLEILEAMALRLPTGLNELSNSFNDLVNRGFKPTRQELGNLSGLAASQRKTFDQLKEAIFDAEQGELERLKEFGIEATNQGNKVSISFKGVTKTFEKGARDSVRAFSDLAKELGLEKLNEKKMLTLEGRMSNLGDQADRITRLVGKAMVGAFEALFTVAEKILTLVDRAVTSWNKFDDALAKVGGTTDKITYPALSRLFGIFSDDNTSGLEAFMNTFRANFDRILTIVSAAAGEIEYLGTVTAAFLNLANAGNGYGWKNFTKDLADAKTQLVADGNAMKTNLRLIKEAEYERQRSGLMARKSKNATDDLGEFQYGPDGKPKPKSVSDADAKKAKELISKYNDERLKLEAEFGKERLEQLKDNQLLYIEEKAKLDKREIELEREKYLAVKKAAYGKKSKLSGKENEMFDSRLGFVDAAAEMEKAKFINEAEKKITETVSNEYQKQLQDTEYKYQQLFKLAEQSGVDRVRLEKQKQKEIAKIELENTLSKIEKQSDTELQDAELNVIRAQISGRLSLEIEARKGLLELEKKFILEKIKVLEASEDPEAKARLAGLRKAMGEIDLGIKDLDGKGGEISGLDKLLGSLGFDDKALEAVDLAASSIKNSVSELYSTLNQLSQQRISRLEDEISKKEEQVDKERELSEEGAANNLALREKELADLKSARERALKDQQRLQKQQLIADTVMQTSSMITASAKVFAALAGIGPFGVAIATGAVALMFGSFAAAKIKAFQAAKEADKYEDGGRVGGKRHSQGGTLIEAEEGEFVTNRKSTAKYFPLIEAINQDKENFIMDYLMTDLLKGTGVGLSARDREKTVTFIREHRRTILDSENDQIRELRELKKELIEIKKSNERIPETQLVGVGEGKYLEKSKNGSIVRELPIS